MEAIADRIYTALEGTSTEMSKESNIEVSVIICTYNRSESLKRTLKSVGEMEVSDELNWELIIVDNNSNDNTRAIVTDFIGKSGLVCKYVFEQMQGLSFAKNAGISNACGNIIAFTDDDVLVGKNWLSNIAKAFQRTGISCIGGKILPIWERQKPEWLREDLYGCLGILDLGEEETRLQNPTIWGANIAIKAELFERYGQFDPGYGVRGNKLYGGEETDLVSRLIVNGETVYYIPDVVIYHHIQGDHLKKAFFRKWRYDKGEQKAINLGYYPERNILGIPLYIIRQTIAELANYLYKLITNPTTSFYQQLVFLHYIGFIVGRVKFMRHLHKSYG